MKFLLRLIVLLCVLTGSLTQDGFDLSDALDDLAPTPDKPKVPNAPEKPKNNDELDLFDAFGPDDAPANKPKEPEKPKNPKNPTSPDSGGFGLDLEDALGPDLKPDKPAVKPSGGGGGGGGGSFGDSDLVDVSGGDYKPDGGRSGGRPSDYDCQGGADQPQEGSGTIAAIASTIGVALLGAASSYFAYQKKKLCFKLQGGQDPEQGKDQRGAQSDPQVFSNLLRTS